MKNNSENKDKISKLKKTTEVKPKKKPNKPILKLSKLDGNKIPWKSIQEQYSIGEIKLSLQYKVTEILTIIDNYIKEYRKYEDTLLFEEIYVDLLETVDLLDRYEEDLIVILFDENAEIPPIFEQYMDYRGIICVQTVDKDILRNNGDLFIKIYG